VTQSGRDTGPYVSQHFAAGRTTTPLKKLSHHPSATRVDPGEGLGRGHASATTKTRGAKDPVLQTSKTLASATTKAAPSFEAGQELTAPLVSFAGQTSPFTPPDPNGDVGPNHYVQMVNSQIQIWNKQGTS
ncbi:hypothetical protein, partial [Erwinia amylovora]|uniref:hypothetical protein n=1 Tax=Erwinia amylovora TaxID=552 RepID=UPI001C5575B8